MKLFIVVMSLGFAAPISGQDFGADSCRGETFSTGVGLRQYSNWTYPRDDWEHVVYNCEHTSATINGQYFARPTRCEHHGPGPDILAEFDVNDKSCSVDHSWLFEKIGKVIAKDFRCIPRSNSDGCTLYEPYYTSQKVAKDYLNAACVVHDICYTALASFGITKKICDDLLRELAQYRCEEVYDQECFDKSDEWFAYTPDEHYVIPDLLQSTYDNAQRANTPCSLTVRQRESSLHQGWQMNIGSTRWSPNGRYVLSMQSDGNLVIYRKPSNRAVWSSKTQGRGVVKAVMQYDGNFVLYTENGVARWHTGTDIKPTNHLLLQDDGNLVVYSMGAPTVQWSRKINGGYLLPMSTNMRTESLNLTSVEDIGTIAMQDALSDPPTDIVHFDRDPNSAGAGGIRGRALSDAVAD